MIIKKNKDLVKQAMNSKCVICGYKICPWDFWEYSEKRNGEKIFVHEKCIKNGGLK